MEIKKEFQLALNHCEPNLNRIDKCVTIANTFADQRSVEFAIWFQSKYYNSRGNIYKSLSDRKTEFTTAELLTIFKAEKGI